MRMPSWCRLFPVIAPVANESAILVVPMCRAVDAARGIPACKCPAGLAARRPQSGYTFHANSRVVLTDVTVTNKRGNPVHGLKATDFRIFDNKEPQEMASFEEHGKGDTVLTSAPGVSPPGVFSNAYLEHPPRVLNILFIDLTNIEIADQMYLNYQLGGRSTSRWPGTVARGGG